jgi:heme exporter protein B
VVWVAALLAAMLSVNQLYAGDLADGSLEQMLVACGPGTSRQARPGAGQGLGSLAGDRPAAGAVAPLFGLMFDMRGEAIAALALTLASARRCSACSAAWALR